MVETAGPGVTGYRPGDRVIGLRDLPDLPLGTHAEHVVLEAAAVAPAPAGLTPAEAATLPLNALTAAQALDALALRPGATVLVTGAAGGVGGFAVELAAARGLRAAALGRPEDEDMLHGLGATWFVPRDGDLTAQVRALVPGGVDGALDAAVLGIGAQGAVRNGGAFAAVIGGAAPAPLRGIRVATVMVRADGAALGHLSELAAAKRLTARVADAVPLADAAAAHARLAGGGLRGRLVLIP
ncbi:zinc-binding dehydrogenase [Streptomyces sp. YIM 98790]|uniref:zinc-binding dehydrogenase n=1 Tax=Streptomyces sp. YIM 98790 TaxID=2689077 RepID=UPI0028BD8B68|nr:zinc-binding dehydrogenase [Streptomyces sp. YIM 98790]